MQVFLDEALQTHKTSILRQKIPAPSLMSLFSQESRKTCAGSGCTMSYSTWALLIYYLLLGQASSSDPNHWFRIRLEKTMKPDKTAAYISTNILSKCITNLLFPKTNAPEHVSN